MEQPKTRDADRSRAAILDAAEALFSEHGFEAITLAQVGAAAGVSRGTPGYFFGTKEALYTTVVERAASALREHVAASGAGLDQTIAAVLELIVRRPSLVKLIDRQRGALIGEPHAEAFRDAVGGRYDDGDPTTLVALALCWFPVSHPGAARALGVDPEADGFVRSWRDRVVAAAAAARPASGPQPPELVAADAPAPPPAPDVGEDAPPPPAAPDVGDGEAESSKAKKKKKKKKKG